MKYIYSLFFFVTFFSYNAFGQSVELNASQINFGTLTYGTPDSVLVEITNLLNEEVFLEAPEFFDFYGSSPFYVNTYPESIEANGAGSFYVVFNPIHNMVHNSEMVVKTSGNRGAVALDLIGECVYPGSYYATTYNLLDEDLESALHTLLAQNYQDYGYSGARDRIFMEIDNQKVNGQGASQNTLTRIYIGTDAVGYTSRSNAQQEYNLNTEHTFPQGYFNSNFPMKSDMHHLFVSDINANSVRGNLRFGNVVSGIDWGEGGSKRGLQADGQTVFEPRDEQKGPSARAILYFVIRYQNYDGFLNVTQEATLRDWSATFPPDAIQKTRNEDIFAYQHNRNPFVDYPQFLDRIYNIRLNEFRPEAGALARSSQSVDFQEVEASTTTTYNLVFTNYGNRYIAITNLGFTDNSTMSFDLDQGLPATLAIYPGESVSIPITCYTTSSSDDLEANLYFNSNVMGSAEVTIPVSASFTTGIETINAYANFQLAPNPASEYVRLSKLDEPVMFIKVFDIAGRLCASFSGNNTRINTSELNPGMYHVLVGLENGKMLKRKLVKQ